MNLRELLEDKYYTGKPLESGGTSITGGAAPALKALVGKVFKRGMKVLDYGAGKYARNADYLRGEGIDTYRTSNDTLVDRLTQKDKHNDHRLHLLLLRPPPLWPRVDASRSQSTM